MDSNFVAFISAIASVVCAITAGVSAYLSYYFKQSDKKDALDKELNRILDIVVQYPYFEYTYFTNDWINHREENDEKYLRYDIYCNMVYNFLHHVFVFYNGRKNLIEEYIDVKSWIRVHKQNWQYPRDSNENIDGYDDAFRNFINSYIQ